jgi:excisionase family DNA binding protein
MRQFEPPPTGPMLVGEAIRFSRPSPACSPGRPPGNSYHLAYQERWMTPPNPEPVARRSEGMLTAQQVAEELNLSLRTIRRLIKDGRLPAKRIGRSVRIRPRDLRALIEAE